ncbi:MAG: PDZ domain-containing protein [Pseudomonadales bacterium]|nr:PDZ domain-containing protein [Pseudomonadales bacterium]
MRALGLMVVAGLGVGAYADDEAEVRGFKETAAELEAVAKELDTVGRELEEAREQMDDAVTVWADRVERLWEAREPRRRAFLGVLIGGESEAGIKVAGVTPDGGAEAAGVRAQDVIVEIDGTRLTGHERPMVVLREQLDQVAPGDPVTVVAARDGDEQSFEVVTTPVDERTGLDPGRVTRIIRTLRGANGPPPFVDDHIGLGGPNLRPGRFLFDTPDGLRLVDIGADLGEYFGVDGGVLVVNTPAGSELKPGDILRRIDDADIASAAEAYRLLWQRPAAREAEDAELEVRRKNRTLTVTMPAIMRDTQRHDTDVRIIEMEVDKQ